MRVLRLRKRIMCFIFRHTKHVLLNPTTFFKELLNVGLSILTTCLKNLLTFSLPNLATCFKKLLNLSFPNFTTFFKKLLIAERTKLLKQLVSVCFVPKLSKSRCSACERCRTSICSYFVLHSFIKYLCHSIPPINV